MVVKINMIKYGIDEDNFGIIIENERIDVSISVRRLRYFACYDHSLAGDLTIQEKIATRLHKRCNTKRGRGLNK